MSQKDKDKEKNDDDNDEIDRRARQMLIDEAKRAAVRAEQLGASAWKKPSSQMNRKFLSNTLISNALHNIRRNERERDQRNRSIKKRRSSSSSDDNRRTNSKRSSKNERSSERNK